MTSRRSFLALLAGALAVRPEELCGLTAPIAQENPFIPLPEDWYRHWMIQDQVTLEPGRETRDALFIPPAPSRALLIRSIGWAARPDILLADLLKIVNHTEFRLTYGGRATLSARLYALDMGRPLALTPPIIVRADDFRLEVASDAMDLSASRELTFCLSGVLKVCDKPPGQAGQPGKKTKATG